jgi:hypothetical protein
MFPMATRSHEGETNSWNLSTVISEEKFKGAVYSINTGQNGITMFFLAISRCWNSSRMEGS